MQKIKQQFAFASFVLAVFILFSCNSGEQKEKEETKSEAQPEKKKEPISQPLVSHIYTADPSAHVFNGRIYIYPSHDTATGIPEDDLGSHFNMMDYHILSMDSIGGKVTDHGVALDIKDVPWAGRQMWAPDAAFANNMYYLYFPVKDKKDVFHIGIATSSKPEGPFKAEKEPIKGSYSIDPCVFKDDDARPKGSSGRNSFYMYFGGIWGGQLQRWNNNKYDSLAKNRKPEEMAILPRIAKLNKDMKSFAEPVKEIKVIDKNGKLFTEKDNDKRFFEAAWVFKYKGKYYFTYSTGDTHFICYATGDNPYGPFTYQGVVLNPVDGWTNHESIVEVNARPDDPVGRGKWYIFYHDTQLSGKTHLRNVKVSELKFNNDGSIQTITAYK
jgi:hypothetical protein